ncbi:hypothetical protein DICPUDRAFT_92970 [Dictyostelium purpureum]|uniref:Uncharacterized protein n=1 Tax=Dictyostelium purpureum TaxID=5786 RepID=F0ZZZ7_DICPU|nr:uncharacterized protein DICPUDRAFT_92970 [Dictyostelium purpureum]EGC30489.1 hypothetical protein DICPUDRAFT_92970 [Dictyostelium purpureum]|eukprot:XP_003292991.1 hypothetical protein DICPUDRAFT_92970 [Dictyostelium purpureum]
MVKTDLRDLIPTRIALEKNSKLEELYIGENSFTHQFSCLKRNNCTLTRTLFYREYMISHLVSLKILDNQEITESERLQATELVRLKFITCDSWREKYQVNQIHKDILNLEINNTMKCRTNINKTTPKTIFKNYTEYQDILNENPRVNTLEKIVYPRQLEYNPSIPNLIVVGAMNGRVHVYDENKDEIIYDNIVSNPSMILGLSWIKNYPCFLAGSENGSINLFNLSKTKNPKNQILSFDPFYKLSSLHTNCQSDTMVVSGSCDFVSIYDINSCTLLRKLEKAHTKKINVVKYASYDPYGFVTSSFDGTVKRWDTRCLNSGPTLTSKESFGEIIMSVFSPDDRSILVSGCDNQVYQLDSRTGTLNIKFEIHRSNQEFNFSRSYYTADGNYCVIGSCDENCVRFYSTSDGKFLRDVSLFDQNKFCGDSDGVLSLRTHPSNNFDVTIIKTKLPNLYSVKF